MNVTGLSGAFQGHCGCGPGMMLGIQMPLLFDPDTGSFKAVLLEKIDGVSVATLVEPTPKIQDDDDHRWRAVYWTVFEGTPTFYLGDPDDNPGYPMLAYNQDTGRIERGFTNQINGQTVLRWAPLD